MALMLTCVNIRLQSRQATSLTYLKLPAKETRCPTRSCSAGNFCLALGGMATLLDARGNPRLIKDKPEPDLAAIFSHGDDECHLDGAVTVSPFPPLVPF